MNDETRRREREAVAERPAGGSEEHRGYRPPRIVKKRAVSRATLFTGSGPDTGGVISAG